MNPVAIKCGLNFFISLDEYLSTKTPCRTCLVRSMCLGEEIHPEHGGPVAITFRDLCEEATIYINCVT